MLSQMNVVSTDFGLK